MDDLDLGDIVLEDKQDSPKPEPQVIVKPTHVTQKEDKLGVIYAKWHLFSVNYPQVNSCLRGYPITNEAVHDLEDYVGVVEERNFYRM